MGNTSSKYTGFGSQDLNKYHGGYDVQGTGSGAYDPFKRKGGSVFDSKSKDKGKKLDFTKKKEKDKKSKKKKKSKNKKKKKSESESEDSDDSSDSSSSESDSEDSSSDEDEKPPKKSKKVVEPKRKGGKGKEKEIKQSKEAKAVKTKAKQKTKKAAPPPASAPDLFELIDSNDTPQPTQTAQSNDVLGGVFDNQPAPQNTNANMFDNMNMGNNNQTAPNKFAFPGTSQPQQTNQPPPSTGGWGDWGSTNAAAPAQTPVQPQAPAQAPSATQNTMNMFENLTITEPQQTQVQQPPAANTGFDIFSGMNQGVPQPAQTAAPTNTGIEGFGDFQESTPAPQPVVEEPPKKEDAWSMGGGLFNLSSLQKDSEKKDKLSAHQPPKPQNQEPNMLYTHKEDLNSHNIWEGALAQETASQNTGFAGSSPSVQPTYGGSAFPNYAQTPPGFPASSQPTGGFQNTNQNFGGASSGFPLNTGAGAFGQNNTQGFSSGFPNSGFPSAQPQTNIGGGFPQPNNQWGGAGGFPSTNNPGFPNSNTGGI